MSTKSDAPFWNGQLADLPILELPTDRPRSPVPSFMRSTQSATLTDETRTRLATLVERDGVSLFTALLTALDLVLLRYTGGDDVVVGSVTSDSTTADDKSFANLVALRSRLDAATIGDCLQGVAKTIADAGEHRSYPFESLVDELGADDGSGRAPIFQVMLVLLDAAGAVSPAPVTRDDLSEVGQHTALCDLVFAAHDDGERLTVECEYDGELFDSATVERILGHLCAMIDAIGAADRDAATAGLSMLTAAERAQLTREWNATDADYPVLCLHHAFEAQVERTPDAVALSFGDEEMTYAELDSRANQLAHELQDLGVEPEKLVGIFVERSLEMMVGIYAVLKAGGAYVPLDPEYPRDRLDFMAKDAQVSVLLTQRHLADHAPSSDARVVVLDEIEWRAGDSTPVDSKASVNNLAYVIYTSGSTGRPKGAMISHRSICNRLFWMQDAFGLTDADRVLQKTPLSFDVSVWELFWPLMSGARLAIAKPGGHRDGAYLVNEVVERGITTMHFVPSMLQAFLAEKDVERCESLRRVICSGEALPHELQQRFFARLPAKLHNLYGPTEAAVDVTHWACQRDGRDRVVPIGRPVANTQIYLLDAAMQPVPIAVPGELCIGGVQVARGYLNRDALTAEKFVDDPFSQTGTKLYKTGDLARYRPDGSIEYLGRIDHQVKLRGFRVELGEIEAVLVEHAEIRECVVVLRDDQLVAYVVPVDRRAPTVGELRRSLAEKVPDYMVPGAFVTLDTMPLTPSGKVDRRALPAPDSVRPELDADFVMPQSEAETRIAEIWRSELQIDEVGVHDNFFELGGHSLLLLNIRVKLQDIFGRDIEMVELFRYPTVESLAKHLGGGTDTQASTERAQLGAAAGSTDIAIIGMTCRLPGADTIDEFWENLKNGVESVTFFSDDELLEAGVEAELLQNPDYVKSSAILHDTELFDAQFFGFSPKEAEMLDPQQRLFLESAWHALERAGYVPEAYDGPIGVYAGVGMNTYAAENLYENSKQLGPVGEFQLMIGNDKDFMPTRVSYKLNLKGPSINVQTACSTSLVAVHMACHGLITGECDMALAGGSSVRVPQNVGYLYQEGMILSPDGHCRTFDAQAQGTIFGSGVGIVVLKRLDDAIRDKDHIHAVIKGSAINNDGSLKVGYTAPSIEGQSAVIAQAQANAGVDPDTVTYVEAHGTATNLGDPIEVAALTQCFRAKTDKKGFCGIGALKTNIGHVDAAAGVAGLIKTVLALENELLPPTLHYEAPNPQIDFANSPFYVVTEPTPWTTGDAPRRAAVSSFGIGGTNAHAILEEAPAQPASQESKLPGQVVTLSGKTEDAVAEQAQRFAAYLAKNPAASLADIAFTTNTGRAHFEHRLAVVADDKEQLREELEAIVAGNGKPSAVRATALDRPKVAFLFTGQGAQYADMGRELFEKEPVFREALERCDEILRPLLERPLLEVLYEEPDESSPLHETAYTQPALFALEYSLACLWRSWGVTPSYAMGHSVGEYVAACIAGVFSLEDGLALIAERGRLMQALPRDGEMFAVFAEESQVTAAIEAHKNDVSVASVNAPNNVVISGRRESVQAAVTALEAAGVKSHKLNVSHAFHSPLMEPMLAEFEQFASGLKLSPPQIDLFSNVTGSLATADVATAPYWRRHVREAVRFADSMAALADAGCELFVEIGPQPTLLGMARHCVPENGSAWIPSLRRGRPERRQILQSVAELHARGVAINWVAFHEPERRRVPLPTYPFQGQRYWVEAPSAATTRSAGTHPLIGERMRLPFSNETRFETRFELTSPTYVEDHRVFGVLVVAGASHVAMFLMGANRAFNTRGCELEELLFLQPFTLSENGARQAQLLIKPSSRDDSEIELVSLPEGADENDANAWVVHVSGRVRPIHDNRGTERADLAAIRERCEPWLDGPEFYEKFWVQGDDAGPAFRWIESIWRRDGEALCKTYLPELPDDVGSYQLHPGLIEATFQALRCCREFESQRLFAENNEIYVPFGIEKLRFFGKPEGQPLWCHATIREQADVAEGSVTGDLWLYDDQGALVAELTGFECRRLEQSVLLRHLQRDLSDWLYRVAWRQESRACAATRREGDWLVVSDSEDIASGLVTRLEQRGERCVVADVASCAARLENANAYRGVIYLGALANDGGELTVASLQRGQQHGCGGALQLIQTLIGAQWDEYPPLWLVTRGTQPVGAEPGALDVVNAPLWGVARVVAIEHPELSCLRVDLDPSASENELDELTEELLASDGEEEVAFRGGARHVARLVHHGRRAHASGTPTTVNGDSNYLVTGGLGALGLKVAEWLVSRGARNIALVGRRPPSPTAAQAIAELEQNGARVVAVAADISNEADVARAIATANEAAPLRGIVHAAGIVDDGVLSQLTWDRFEAVMAPKVTGTWHLHTQTRDLPLDFFVLFSSATSLLGAAGQANYATANAFLDALAHDRRSQGLPATSINWGPWAEVGMAAELDDQIKHRMEQHGWEYIPPEHGVRALGELVAQEVAQAGVLPIHWTRFFENAHGTPPRLLSELGHQTAESSQTSGRRDDLIEQVAAAPERERKQLLVSPVRELVAAVLGLNDAAVSLRQGFTDMGMDSLMGIELRRRLQETFGVRLASTFAFDYPNVEDVTEFLADELAGAPAQAATNAATDALERVEDEIPQLSESEIDSSIEDELAKLEASLKKDEDQL